MLVKDSVIGFKSMVFMLFLYSQLSNRIGYSCIYCPDAEFFSVGDYNHYWMVFCWQMWYILNTNMLPYLFVLFILQEAFVESIWAYIILNPMIQLVAVNYVKLYHVTE